jgi:uncharacterized membrane protein YphA (DoxX/SURF4 family)
MLTLRSVFRQLPQRLVTGAYILHSGIEKWGGSPEQAVGIHRLASGAYPVLKDIEPTTFLKILSMGEMATGTLLLLPIVPNRVAGAALTGFSGALVTMYLRTPALHKPGSVWPSQSGIAVSKDVWMLGIGTGLLLDSLTTSRRSV